MCDYEKLGVFYLGRHYDPIERRRLDEPVLYDSRHLLTHALVIGMTGSGKTGLCFGIIEEAAIDGIPSILVDPKGDLGNLLLTFPDLRPEDFAPWINEEDARRRGVSVAEFAAEQADLWRKGLAAWGQNGDRIRRLRSSADFAIYTPGSGSGRPLSILKSFAVPPVEIMEDIGLLRERVSSTVVSLLGLAGIDADPVKSRESVLLANILQHSWKRGQDMDIAGLIQEVQRPSLQRIGVIDVEALYPANERFELAIRLNNLLAAPGFEVWAQGEPLDVGRLLYTDSGKPRVAILSIAHLGDAERMFFVTLLLNEVLGWMRRQSGTTSLRALMYMDEIFGYFPPVAAPPSKQPLLTLLKQARAYGLGIVLATQNPSDLDYKGLSNIGTWFIGRLQTDRDKARLLEGLEGAAAGRGAGLDRVSVERIISGLGSRVFMLHDVQEEGPQIFESRWALSYLRGPLSLAQVKSLVQVRPLAPAAPRVESARAVVAAAPQQLASAAASPRPVLPPQVPQFFVPVRSAPMGTTITYQPRLLGNAQVRYADARLKVDLLQDITVMTEITDSAVPVDWAAAEELAITTNQLEKTPIEGEYAPCAPAASQVKNYSSWAKDFAVWIQNNRRLSLLCSPSLNQYSKPGEDERDFRIRLQQVWRETRDAAAQELRRKYGPKIASLQERLRRAEAAREREAEQAKRAKMDAVISLGSTLLGAFLGRRTVSTGTVGKAATTMRSAGRVMGQAGDVKRAEETVEAIQQQLRAIEEQFQSEVESVMNSPNPLTESLDTIVLRPNKSDISVRLLALVWLPFARDNTGALKPAY
ncbi:MAG: ATP-binding protein [Verrucomicrobiota bacterium]|nr:ATP-binding protein [Verrucomicrobiota bacterium]